MNSTFVFGAGPGDAQAEHTTRNVDQEKGLNLTKEKDKSQKPKQRFRIKKKGGRKYQ